MKYYILLISAAFFWGCNFYLASYMVQITNIFEAAFWRYLFGILCLSAFIIKDLPSISLIKEIGKVVVIIGFVGLFIFNCFFFYGMSLSSPINAALIVGLNPAFTLILSHYVLKTPIHFTQIIGIIIAFIGVLYLIQKGRLLFTTLNFELGNLFILISTLLFAVYNVSVKKYGKNIKNSYFTFGTTFTCFLGFLFILPFSGMGQISCYPIEFWLSAIGIGTFGTGLAYIFWNKGLNMLGASKSGIFLNIVPLATASISFCLGEPLAKYHIISGLLILSGIIIMQKNN